MDKIYFQNFQLAMLVWGDSASTENPAIFSRLFGAAGTFRREVHTLQVGSCRDPVGKNSFHPENWGNWFQIIVGIVVVIFTPQFFGKGSKEDTGTTE